MKRSILSITVGLIAVLATTIAWGFAVGQTKTEAKILPPSPNLPAIQLEFKAELFDGVADPASDDVVATWERVGGVEPVPFKVFILALLCPQRPGF